MSSYTSMIKYGNSDINYEVVYTNRKKTIEVSVHPDSKVLIKAPKGASSSKIEGIVKKRAKWILRHIEYFKRFEPRTPTRRYLSGETHLYLGKRYRLKIRKAEEDSIKLNYGFFNIATPENKNVIHIKTMLQDWYMTKAKIKFAERYYVCSRLFDYPEDQLPKLKIREMKTRWGSYSTKGNITLNLQLIKTPVECIDYVIIHELCHVIHKNHSKDFYQLLATKLPDWPTRKHKLEIALT